MLTAADVEQKTFSTALRGYDLDEVDDFLDEIVATIRDLTEQLEAAQAAAASKPAPVSIPAPAPKPEPAPAPEPPAPVVDESAIGRALVAAQTAADQLLAQAEEEAEKIVTDAKGEADTWQADREAKKAEAEAEIMALAARVASVRSELSVLAGEVAGKLDDMDAVIERGGTDENADTSTGDSEAEAPETDSPVSIDDPSGSGTEQSGSEPDSVETGGDHLDALLTGVATDLQLRDAGDDVVDEGREGKHAVGDSGHADEEE